VICLKRKSVLTAGPRPDASLTTSPAEIGSTAMVTWFLTGKDADLCDSPAIGCVIEEKYSLICTTIKRIMGFSCCLGQPFWWSLREKK